MIEQRPVRIYSPEEKMNQRVKHVYQLLSMMRQKNSIINENVEKIINPQKKKRPHNAEYYQDAAIAIAFRLQTDSKNVPSERIETMIDIFSQKPIIAPVPDEQLQGVLDRLEEEMPMTHRSPQGIVFSNPDDIAAFTMIEAILNGKPNRSGQRVVELDKNFPGYHEAEELSARINQYMPERNRIIVIPTPGKKEVGKKASKAATELLEGLTQVNKAAQKMRKKKARNDVRLERDGVPFKELEIALKKMSKSVHLKRIDNRASIISRSQDAPAVQLYQKKTSSPEFYSEEKVTYDESLPFCAFLLNANEEKMERVTHWMKQEGSNRAHFEAVRRHTLNLIDMLHNEEHYKTLSFALVDDILSGDITHQHLKNQLRNLYRQSRNIDRKIIEKELFDLPIAETAARIFLVDQISTLAGEIDEGIRVRRNRLRTLGSDKEGFDLEAQERRISEKGFGILYNERIRYGEVNLTSSRRMGNNNVDIDAFFDDKDEREQKVQELIVEKPPEYLFNLLIFMGIEKWSQSADDQNPWGGRKIAYTIGEKTDDQGKTRHFKEYILPSTIEDPDQPKRTKHRVHIIESKSETQLLVPITVEDSYMSEHVDFLYKGVSVGALQAEERKESESI